MQTLHPYCPIKINGGWIRQEAWNCFGYAWDNGELPIVEISDQTVKQNFLSCLFAILNGEKQALDYNSDVGGSRGRTAFGFKADGTIVIVCTSDKAPITVEQTQDKLFANGCISGIVLDGGGSSQCITPAETIVSARIVSNLVCVWIDKTGDKNSAPIITKESDTLKICLDPGHGAGEMNQSPDGTYFEHEFALDMAKRIREHLIRCGVSVKLTREDSSTPSLTARATTANNFGADLLVSLHSNAVGGNGWNDTAHGLSVWTYAQGGERDKAANALLAQMAAVGVETFGSKLYHSKFTVLAESNMPAYLIEYAFHTCHNDVELLKSDSHRAKLAEATAKAICAWGGTQWVDKPVTQTTTYKVQIDLTDETQAEQLVTDLTAKGYKPYITTM